ncbi:MAG: alanine racemase [Deltaproteobacteria bacterium]
MSSHTDLAQYERYRRLLADEVLPAALVDLDAVDRNVETLLAPVRANGKTLRLASKSVRCVALLRHVIARGAGTIRGVMTYTAAETLHLATRGFDDLLLAYPTVRTRDLEAMADANARGAWAATIVDCSEHLDAIERVAAERGVELPVVIDVDVSYRPVGDRVVVGVRRSPVRTVEAAVALAERVGTYRHLRFGGVMAYEAHIAGLGDANPYAPALNAAKSWLRRRARPHLEQTREALAHALAVRGLAPRVFNGGGTGSLAWCSAEASLTEVTAGSGFLDSHLFDYFRGLHLAPAVGFALQVVRRPAPGVVTCHGGGYVASGEAGPDRLPRPWLPAGMSLFGLEGAGEVQTPVRLPDGLDIALGDPLFFRHAKAGELAEHFREYLLVRGDRIEARVPTYRGEGQAFLG